MSLTSVSAPELDTLIEECTNESIPNGEIDLPVALEISDIIRSRRVPPKDGMRCLKKRILTTRSNSNTQFATWRLVEVCMKNGGVPFLREICSREFMDCLEHDILSDSTDYELQRFCARLVMDLYLAFKNDSQLKYVSTVYQKLLSRGVEMKNLASTENVSAMFDAKTPADWVDSDACMICSVKFTLLNRKHHCRSCGGIFCQEHSSRFIPLPDLGILEPVRVCDNCFEDYNLKKSSSKKKGSKHRAEELHEEDDDLRKAIELSLQESNSKIQQDSVDLIPVEEPVEEEDPDLKAAIEASLRDHKEEESRRKRLQLENSHESKVSVEQPFELTSSDEEDIQLFASLVERMKTQPPEAILEDTQLQQLYQKVISARPKVNYSLNDTVSKYNSLFEMNGRISDIMNIYDTMLEEQLRNITYSQQYSFPQASAPSSYTYYPNNPQTANLENVSNAFPNESFVKENVSSVTPSSKEKNISSNPDFTSDANITATQLEGLVLDQPSEPPYPTEDEVTSEGSDQKNNVSEAPYPDDTIKQEDITKFDFPAVPLSKIAPEEQSEKETVLPQKQEEELLIEL